MPTHPTTPKSFRRSILLLGGVASLVLIVAGVYGCRTLARIEYGDETVAALPVDGALADSGDAGDIAQESVVFTARESGILTGPLDDSGSIASAVFWPAGDRSDRFLVNDAEGDEPVTVVRTIRLLEDGTVEVVRTPEGDDAAPDFASRTVLARGDGGDVVVRFNAASKIESTFDPASLFLPASLKAGESVERPFTVDAVGPRFGTGKGEGSITVTGLGMQAVRTPAGDFEAFVFASESSFQIGPATITRTRRAWVALSTEPGSTADHPGIVAEESGQTVKVFGISFSSKAWVSVLVD